MYETDFSEATLIEANLQGTQLAKTIFEGAKLEDCTIYGLAAWDLNLKNATQKNHIIKYRYGREGMEAEITVDDLQVAQFIYLLLNNSEIKSAMDQINSKAVLLLGRFTDERKGVLEELRKALRGADLVPIIFDFERPAARTFREIVVTLAGLSRFIIVDITDPGSVQLELQATVPTFQLPFVPIIQENWLPFSMFKNLYDALDDAGKGRMLPLLPYASKESLVRNLKRVIIEPAQQRANELTAQKAKPLPVRDPV